MINQKVIIKNSSGLQLMPTSALCREAMRFHSLVTFTYKETTANVKSILSVLSACVKCGDEIELVCEGEDEEQALQTLVSMIEDGLGE